jgi:hypothetical protein
MILRAHTFTQKYPRIPFECPRIPQNTNNIQILKDFHKRKEIQLSFSNG